MGGAVLVAGAGIAGTAAALALAKAGFAVEVYEAHPRTGADIGAFLTLAANGMRALGQLDAAAPVAAAGFALTELRVLGADGAELGMAPLGGHEDPLTSYRCLRRADLCAVLRAEAEHRGISIRHGTRLVAVEEDADGVTARFADGDTARGALLIGADGLNSIARTLLDPAATRPRYAGQRVFYGYTKTPVPGAPPAPRITMIRATNAAFGYAVSPAGETYWFARVPGPPTAADAATAPDAATPRSGPPADGAPDGLASGGGSPDSVAAAGGASPAAASPGGGESGGVVTGGAGDGDGGVSAGRWRDELVALLRVDATPAADIVAATGDIMATDARDLPDVARGRGAPHGRTLLVGDAAHAASPATGQGASMALEDAIVLAKALRARPLPEALDTYERVRRPRVSRNITTSARLTAARTDQPPEAPAGPTTAPSPNAGKAGPAHVPGGPHAGEQAARPSFRD